MTSEEAKRELAASLPQVVQLAEAEHGTADPAEARRALDELLAWRAILIPLAYPFLFPRFVAECQSAVSAAR